MGLVPEVDSKGIAIETGEVNEGEIIVTVPATFGTEVWSMQILSLDRFNKAISVTKTNAEAPSRQKHGLVSALLSLRRKSYNACSHSAVVSVADDAVTLKTYIVGPSYRAGSHRTYHYPSTTTQ